MNVKAGSTIDIVAKYLYNRFDYCNIPWEELQQIDRTKEIYYKLASDLKKFFKEEINSLPNYP